MILDNNSAAVITVLKNRSENDMVSAWCNQNEGTYDGLFGMPKEELSVAEGTMGLRHTTGAEYLQESIYIFHIIDYRV